MIIETEQYRRWSKNDYVRMAETGILADGERTELFEGVILTLSPNNPPHANSVSRLTMMLAKYFQEKIVRVQLPLDVSDHSLPEPDFAIVAADALQDDAHPQTAYLVIEVADSSLKFDRTEKMSLYARAKIPEYWIVNVADRVLEVYREPAEDSQASLGWAYRRREVFEPEQAVCPLALQQAEFSVAQMF